MVDGRLACSNCRNHGIRIMWNIKAVLVDSEAEITCKINSEIMEKIIGMSPTEGVMEFLKNPEGLKKTILDKLDLLKGVFKINAKLNPKKEGDRFYNIC